MKTLHTIYTNFAKRAAIALTLLFTLGVTTAWAAVYTYDCTSNKNFYTDAGLTTNPSTGSSNAFAENASFYAEDGACFTVLRASKVYFNSGYLMVGNYQPVLQLPTYANEKITKVKFWNSSGCSTSVKVTIKSGSNIAAAQQTWSNKGSSYTYNISETYQSSTLKLDVTSANAQITKIEITTSAACANSVDVSAGTKTNVNSISFSSGSIATCSSTATDRQVTITVTPNTGYEMTSGARLTFTKTSGTATATYVSGPTVSGSSYQFVYRFNQNDNGAGTFSASCTPKKTIVSFDQNGGEGGQTASVTATYGQNMPTPITLPTRYGYIFGGYYDGAGGTGTQYYKPDGTSARTWNKTSASATLYAKWTEKALTNYRTSCNETTQLDAPTNLTVTNITSTSVTLSWDEVANAEKYEIVVKKEGNTVKQITADGITCVVTELEANTDYTWCVSAVAEGYINSEATCSSFKTKEELTDNCRWVEIALEDITPEDEIVVTMGNDEIGYALGTEKITNSPKSQAIIITSGMIDINQDFDYSKYNWSISAVTGGYTLQPYGTTDTYLYGVTSYISIGNNTNNIFTIFTSPENGNKCFAYVIGSNAYFLGYGKESNQDAWKQLTSYKSLLASNTLKFYKKTCLPANKFWVDYELANVTCTNTPPPFAN